MVLYKLFIRFKPLIFAFIFLLSIACLVKIVQNLGYGFSYAATTSMPKGWYFISPPKTLTRKDIVLFYPPEITRQFLQEHKWGPSSGLLLKYVKGIPGDEVCIRKQAIWINKVKIAPIYAYYAPGKLLPHSNFCGILAANQYLLMSTYIARSFDGRYFGPVQRAQIIGKAKRLL
jgi:conjugative transfer signal peptidase TraF